MNISAPHWPSIFGLTFLSIVFLQSGIDKMINYKQELGWIQQKFARSFLYNYVAILFLILSVSELVSGLLSAAGIFQVIFTCGSKIAMMGAWASTATIIMLIFGQRITKDYTGASSLVPYFLACILTLYFLVVRATGGGCAL